MLRSPVSRNSWGTLSPRCSAARSSSRRSAAVNRTDTHSVKRRVSDLLNAYSPPRACGAAVRRMPLLYGRMSLFSVM